MSNDYDNRRANFYIDRTTGKGLIKLANAWTLVTDALAYERMNESNLDKKPLIRWQGPLNNTMKQALGICTHKGAKYLKICPTCGEQIR